MDPKEPAKGTNRDHWQKSGSPDALQALTEPPFPDDLAYLYAWAKALHGRSGVMMGGVLPLSHREIVAWTVLTGHRPTPLDVEGLLALDAVMINPEKPKESEPVIRGARPWPTRKA